MVILLPDLEEERPPRCAVFERERPVHTHAHS
jgi:hypothetical protein